MSAGAAVFFYGCSGRPGFRFKQGDPLPCSHVAQVRLETTTTSGWRRLMCVDCAEAFDRHCARNALPRPLYSVLEETTTMSYAERTKRPPRTLTDAEVKKILKVTGESAGGFRDHVIISLALGCGLRESEIVGLDVLDVSKDGLQPKRSIQLRVFKRASAGADPSDHRVHVPDATYYKLEKYLKARWWNQRPGEGQPLFIARGGRRLSTRRLREMFRNWQIAAGFDQLYNFHMLRHTAITAVRRKSNIRLAQRFARHANIATTVRYDHVSDEEVARAVKDMVA